MAYVNNSRKKYESYAVASTSISGTVGTSGGNASMDDVIGFIDLTTQTAGTIAFKIQISSDDGTTWFDHPDSTAAIAATGAVGRYIVIARAPIGSEIRLDFVIVTGPSVFTLKWEFSKRGNINRR